MSEPLVGNSQSPAGLSRNGHGASSRVRATGKPPGESDAASSSDKLPLRLQSFANFSLARVPDDHPIVKPFR